MQALADLFCADGPPLALVEEERIYINRVTDAVRQAQAEISTLSRRSPLYRPTGLSGHGLLLQKEDPSEGSAPHGLQAGEME